MSRNYTSSPRKRLHRCVVGLLFAFKDKIYEDHTVYSGRYMNENVPSKYLKGILIAYYTAYSVVRGILPAVDMRTVYSYPALLIETVLGSLIDC
jgi:hypothetical protein